MMITAEIKLNDNEVIKNLFRRYVFCNLYVGIKNDCKNADKKPYLIAVTSNRTLRYEVVNNIKNIITKKIDDGKCSIIFRRPFHFLLIRGVKTELQQFLKLLYELSNDKGLSHLQNVLELPKISGLKFIPKSKEKSSSNHVRMNKTDANVNEKAVISEIVCLKLRQELMRNLQKLHLPNSDIKDLPHQLGRICLIDVDLEGNDLRNIHLAWLEELQIRKSLQKLNLSNNKLTAFPSALVEFLALESLNLRNNDIRQVPGEMERLHRLRYLNLSQNNLRYLPVGLIHLQLDLFDVTYNYLTDGSVSTDLDILCKPILLESDLRLQDLAAKSVKSSLRCQQTVKDCPARLLQKLRYISRCACENVTFPYPSTQFYKVLPQITFATSYWVYPQKGNDPTGSEHGIYVQYHLCPDAFKCRVRKRMRRFILD